MENVSSPPLERKFSVNGLTLSAQQWGIGNTHKVITLHGWLDNSASFFSLGPRLKTCEVVALDFAGHGYSDHRSEHGSYNIWDDILDILAIADQLGWESFNLLAHSRGSFVAILLAASMPERIKKIFMIDGALGFDNDPAEAPKDLRNYLLDQRRLFKRESKVYSNYSQAIAKRREKMSVSEDECLPLVSRGMKINMDNGYLWRHDPRLLGSSAVKLSLDHQMIFLNSLMAPAFLLVAEEGFAKWTAMHAFIKDHSSIQIEQHPGSHHMHMQEQHVDSISRLIGQFFSVD